MIMEGSTGVCTGSDVEVFSGGVLNGREVGEDLSKDVEVHLRGGPSGPCWSIRNNVD